MHFLSLISTDKSECFAKFRFDSVLKFLTVNDDLASNVLFWFVCISYFLFFRHRWNGQFGTGRNDVAHKHQSEC